jgi:hypothetical protein
MTELDPSTAAAVPTRRSGRRRRVLAGILGLLACLALVASTSLLWIHQAALNTDRWVAITANVAKDPAVVASLSEELSQQVMTGLDVQGRLQTALPDQARLLAGAISTTVQTRLTAAIAKLLSSDGFERAWSGANRVAHETLIKLLRGESDSVTLENGYVTLNLFPLVGAALANLQSDGIIPASVSLPDLSDPAAPDKARAALQSALGVTLPDTFGTIALVRADRLVAARTAVHVFDLLVVAALLITLILFIGAVLLARDRRRAILLLGAGVVVALLIARAAVRGVEGAVVGAISDGPGAVTVQGVLDAAIRDLFSVLLLVTVFGAIVAIAAWLFGRREQVAGVVTSAGSAARQAGTAGVVAGRSMASGASAPTRPSAMDWARAHKATLRIAGVLVAAVWLAIIADGWEPVAIIGALLILYQVGLGPLLGDAEDSAAPEPDEVPEPIAD